MPELRCKWKYPPSDLTISSDEVHVWLISLDLPVERIKKMGQILSADEQSKAGSFRFERDRRQYIVRHGAMREILAGYLRKEPEQLEFNYSPLGKPALGEIKIGKQLSFSLSHSNSYAVCAVTINRSIGIDLEYIKADLNVEPIAKHFFSSIECEFIHSSPANQRKNAFYKLWTLKEAYLKGTGEGIGKIKHIEFSMVSERTPSLVIRGETCPVSQWTMLQMLPATDYIAGLAVEGNEMPVKLYCVAWV